MKLFCIIDKKASSTVAVFSSISEEAAKRSFMDLLTVPQDNIYNLHFEDFAVYSVGEISVSASFPLFSEHLELVFDGSSLDRLVVQSEREKRLQSMIKLNQVVEGGDSDV